MPHPMVKVSSEKTQSSRPVVSKLLIGLGIVTLLAALLGSGIWPVHLKRQPQVIATNGSDRWAHDVSTTPASIPFAAPETLQIPVDPAFIAYYRAHAGATLLGAPVTPGFPIAQGWMQCFTTNALLLPGSHKGATTTVKGQRDRQIERLMQDGRTDRRTGIIELPLLQTLLTVGSQAHVGGGLTYVDLRTATHPNQMAPQSARSQGTFIQTGTRDGEPVGHVIPPALLAFITRRARSPDCWQTDFGAPLTDAIPFVAVRYGVSHRLLIQVFQRTALVMDRDVNDASGSPLIQPLDTGAAYLQTLTPPAPVLGARTALWTSSTLDILDVPVTGNATLQLGPHFPLTLAGQPQWDAGTLWYLVRWKTPTTSGLGWAPASGLTLTAPRATSEAWTPARETASAVPGATSPWASFEQLAPGLAQYLASQGDHTAAVVYDLTRHKYYAYRPDSQYLMGQAVKLPIVVAFLAMREQQGRQPSAEEIHLLTTMMATNDVRAEDDEAGEAIYNSIGRALGLKEYLNHVGITGLTPENDDLLYSMTQPLAMVQLLTLLYEGRLLTPQDRALVFSLLEQTEPDQQVGIGDTRPQGSTVTMKDGWVMGTDDRWAMNSAGIVTVGNETYVVAVSSAHLNSLAEGRDIARQVCTSVASLLA